MRQRLGTLDAARQALDGGAIGCSKFEDLDGEISARSRLAEQYPLLGDLRIGEAERP
jgi:hypothetical protein